MRQVLVLLLLLCVATAGCDSTEGGSGFVEEDLVEVPDIFGSDGAEAVSSVEAEGLEVTLADAGNDYGFDTSRDATGCEVTDQFPSGGEVLSPGEPVTITVDCGQTDWENQLGMAWAAFGEAYSSGFDEGCDALFGVSPNGSLYAGDYEYTARDCQRLNPGDGSQASDLPADVPDEPEVAGADAGALDGCRALFEDERLSTLNYGTDAIAADDCPVS